MITFRIGSEICELIFRKGGWDIDRDKRERERERDIYIYIFDHAFLSIKRNKRNIYCLRCCDKDYFLSLSFHDSYILICTV